MHLAPRILPLLALTSSQLTCASKPATAVDPNCTLVESGVGAQGTVNVKVETVVTGLEVPWGIAFLPGNEMLVTERPGRVRLIRDGQLTPRSPNLRSIPRAKAACSGSPSTPSSRRHDSFTST
jgi:glucose/arabinose dehydrogenase